MPDLPGAALPNLQEATRLVRAGKLMDATRAIRQALAGDAHVASTADSTLPPIIDGEFRVVPAHELHAQARAPDAAPHASSRADSARGTMFVGTFLDATFDATIGGRRYKLYVPASRTDARLPLVVMLHGCTQDPDDFARGTRMNALGDEFGVAVLYPAQEARANGSKCWNWFRREDQRRDAGEPAFIADLTRHVIATHHIDPARVFVAGLSAGGAMAAILGREYPDLFAAVGVHSGLPPGAAGDVASAFGVMRKGGAAPARAGDHALRAPTIVFHGDDDGTVHPRNGEDVMRDALVGRALREDSAHTQHVQRRVWRDAHGVTIGEFWQVRGLGHAWSGGSADGSYTATGGPDASREMLRFFLAR